MKKAALIFILLLPFLASCDTDQKSLTYLTFGKLYDSSLSWKENMKEIDYIALNDYVTNQDSFILFVGDDKQTCDCYVTFTETLSWVMEKDDYLIHYIDINAFSNNDNFGLKLSHENATLAIFKDGVIADQYTAGSTSDPMVNDRNVLRKWLEERLHNSDMLYVTKDQLEKLYEGKETFSIYFSRSTCSDCSFLDEQILKSYNQKDRNTSYLIDCDQVGVRLNDDLTFNEGMWNAFKEEYGLTEKEDYPFGYDTGYVPTFLYVDPNIIIDDDKTTGVTASAVYLNDGITKKDDGYYVTRTFYTEERMAVQPYLDSQEVTPLQDLKISEEEVLDLNGTYTWKKEDASKVHDPLITLYLDYYLKKE